VYLQNQLAKRAAERHPVRVGLIGAGKFGSMFLSQVPSTPALQVSAIADLEELIMQTRFTDDACAMMASGEVEVVVEATGNPAAGLRHAREAINNGLHIVMVNVEADVLAGPLIAHEARQAGLVYSMAYGDQPALTCELIEWARTTGFEVIAAGKGTKFLPEYHACTPDAVWEHYGLSSEQAVAAGMNSQMFNSFLDGTKSALEMAAIANAAGLSAPADGLGFPPAGMDDLAHVLRPRSEGGQLEAKGQVEVVSSLERDGRPVFKDLRWGVYVVIEAPNDYSAACFRQYGIHFIGSAIEQTDRLMRVFSCRCNSHSKTRLAKRRTPRWRGRFYSLGEIVSSEKLAKARRLAHRPCSQYKPETKRGCWRTHSLERCGYRSES